MIDPYIIFLLIILTLLLIFIISPIAYISIIITITFLVLLVLLGLVVINSYNKYLSENYLTISNLFEEYFLYKKLYLNKNDDIINKYNILKTKNKIILYFKIRFKSDISNLLNNYDNSIEDILILNDDGNIKKLLENSNKIGNYIDTILSNKYLVNNYNINTYMETNTNNLLDIVKNF